MEKLCYIIDKNMNLSLLQSLGCIITTQGFLILNMFCFFLPLSVSATYLLKSFVLSMIRLWHCS